MSNGVFRLLPEGLPGAGMAPSDITSPESFTSADRTQLGVDFFATDDESVSAGVWLCAPCRSEIENYPVHELMTVISGSVTVTAADGKAETFTAGDTFFIAKGTKCVWEITETLKKFYMITA